MNERSTQSEGISEAATDGKKHKKTYGGGLLLVVLVLQCDGETNQEGVGLVVRLQELTSSCELGVVVCNEEKRKKHCRPNNNISDLHTLMVLLTRRWEAKETLLALWYIPMWM